MLLRIYDEDVELVNHSDPRQRRADEVASATAGAQGSSSAQADTEEVAKRFENGVHDNSIGAPQGSARGGNSSSSSLEPELQGYRATKAEVDGRALEEDAIAKEDRQQADALEANEAEDAKIAAAMPERAGEGDKANTTV